ncbi:MAG TPA: short-chain dehydrogenase/reductase [Steroidobacteraceae bacterium]|nr:short-chain dehydrogenase/reductase [Steroidobacteraceae bacterium]
MELDLRGRSVLITGGSHGIGLATARAFAVEGCRLHLAARNESRLCEVQREIAGSFGVEVRVHPLDLSIADNARALAHACSDVDILVNNAGAVPGGGLGEIDEARWRAAWSLKVLGYVNLTREIYRAMAERGRGVVVNVIGTAGNIVPASYIAGVSGSASLVAFTQALGGMSLDRGVRVVGVSPGDVLNDRGISFLRQQAAETLGDPERWRERLADQPGKRAATEEDIANAVVFLASDRAGYISGEVLAVDGGLRWRQRVL